jgi:hypothetical protein
MGEWAEAFGNTEPGWGASGKDRGAGFDWSTATRLKRSAAATFWFFIVLKRQRPEQPLPHRRLLYLTNLDG